MKAKANSTLNARSAMHEQATKLCNQGSEYFLQCDFARALSLYRESTSILEQLCMIGQADDAASNQGKTTVRDRSLMNCKNAWSLKAETMSSSSDKGLWTISMKMSPRTPLIFERYREKTGPQQQANILKSDERIVFQIDPSDNESSQADAALSAVVLYNFGALFIEHKEFKNAMEMLYLVHELFQDEEHGPNLTRMFPDEFHALLAYHTCVAAYKSDRQNKNESNEMLIASHFFADAIEFATRAERWCLVAKIYSGMGGILMECRNWMEAAKAFRLAVDAFHRFATARNNKTQNMDVASFTDNDDDALLFSAAPAA